MQAFLRYLYSTSNIVGSCAALAVLLCFIFGIIQQGWILLAAGAYLAGALPFAFSRPPSLHIAEGLSTTQALQELKQKFLPRLQGNERKILQDIITRVEGLMPRLKEMEAQGVVDGPSRAMLKQTVTRLLPDALETFLRLPPAYAKTHKLGNGQTAQQVLATQLQLLDEHVVTLEENLLSADVNSLLANGAFLQEKLQPGLRIFD